MATVRDILRRKGSQVYTVAPHATVLNAALLMNEHRIGSLVVLEENRVRGIITERDILQRVVVPRRDPSTALVEEVMTAEVFCGRLDTPVDEIRNLMKDRRFRHLPIVDEAGSLCGMISIGDVNAHDTVAKEQTIHLLEDYIHGYV